METNPLLKTPMEFINEESENLKSYLDNYDIQINKLGFTGFLLNLLGHMRYDATHYYQGLHKESFVALAEKANNLYMHASIYGYTVPFAKPAIAEGQIVFDFSYLPKTKNSKRSVSLSNIKFEYDSIPFETDTTYHFVEENGTYYAIVYLEDGTTKYIPSPTQRISVPFFNVKQLKVISSNLQLPSYPYGTYYPHEFNIDDNYLTDIEIYIKEEDSDIKEKFDIKTVKYLENQFSKTCFLRALTSHNYLVEFGSGVRALHIPNAFVTFYKTLTKGTKGHIYSNKQLKLDSRSVAKIETTEGNNNISRATSARFFEIYFDKSENGRDTPTDEKLKTDIIEFIQTKEFLIDKKDYYNLTPNDKGDFLYSFRKSHIIRNDFYLHKVLRNEYQIPYLTNCINVKKINTDESISGLESHKLSEDEGELEGDYKYTIFATTGFHISKPVTVDINVTVNNTLYFTWDQFDDAEYYVIIVYSYNDESYRYFNIQENQFLDIGQSSYFSNTFINEFNNDIVSVSPYDSYIFFPEFKLNDRTFRSLFVYKYDHNMNWYDGYLFYDDFIMLFSRTMEKLKNHATPQFQLNVVYNYEKFRTEFYIISPQSSEDYAILVTIPGTNINRQQAARLDENEFYIEYTDTLYGIFEDNIIFEMEVYYSDEDDEILTDLGIIAKLETSSFYQLQKVADQLKLLNYITDTNEEYVLSIPIIEKENYLSNRVGVDLEVLSNIYQNDIEGRRFPNDEVQYRFINTDLIKSLYLKCSTVQKYEFDLQLPLKLNIEVIYNSEYLESNLVDLPKEKENLYLEVAKLLQSQYSGNEITFYNSQLIDYIHTNRPYFKSVKVKITDSLDNSIDFGIESYDEDQTMRNIQDEINNDPLLRKFDILNYFPHFFYWDVDNIEFTYSFNS